MAKPLIVRSRNGNGHGPAHGGNGHGNGNGHADGGGHGHGHGHGHGNGHALPEAARFHYLEDRLKGLPPPQATAAPTFQFLDQRRPANGSGDGGNGGNGHGLRGPPGPRAPAALVSVVEPVKAPPQRSPPPSARTASPEIKALSRDVTALIDMVSQVIVGKHEVLDDVAVCLLAGGNILFEDYPGLAKTLLANTFARASGCTFRRIQFTPDTFPADITGSNMFDQKAGEFKFRPGPVFGNVLLADEINRAPPKTQAALLEAMQERQVTIDGETHKLPKPFLVMATQNPVEQEGTYPLPEAQMDRFLMRLSMGYPSRVDEAEILRRRIARGSDEVEVKAVTTPERLAWMQGVAETVHIDEALVHYIADVVARTREHPGVHVGSSPRGSQGLLKAARARAAMKGRGFVTPDDVKVLARNVLGHRLTLKPEARLHGIDGSKVMAEVLAAAPVPAG